MEVVPYQGDNPLYRHGPIRVAADHRHFAHADGTPFFWLGDTWWMGLCRRLHWPQDFQTLAADRKQKGFNVVQIVAGLYPDMPAFDPRGANEAGFPWEKDYARIRPEYFDQADRRLQYLADEGFVPCIVGAWGYHLPWLGIERMKKHWRYLVARYGALPVVWCAAGEGTMPFYRSQKPNEDAAFQKQGWTAVIRSIRSTDPFGRIITIHPSGSARDTVTDPAVLDFDMHQTGHGPESIAAGMARQIQASYDVQPAMPVIAGESSYDGLDLREWGGGVLSSAASRQMFWTGLMHNGAAGGTYGANGIWQVNRRDAPYGPSPHGRSWGSIPWDESMKRAGSTQVALAKKLLMQYEWWRFVPHAEWAAFTDAPSVGPGRLPLDLVSGGQSGARCAGRKTLLPPDLRDPRGQNDRAGPVPGLGRRCVRTPRQRRGPRRCGQLADWKTVRPRAAAEGGDERLGHRRREQAGRCAGESGWADRLPRNLFLRWRDTAAEFRCPVALRQGGRAGLEQHRV